MTTFYDTFCNVNQYLMWRSIEHDLALNQLAGIVTITIWPLTDQKNDQDQLKVTLGSYL